MGPGCKQVLLLYDKKDFNLKLIKRIRETPNQGAVNQKDITILNTCAPNPGALNLIKNVLADLKT